jgi:hypothetical protein
MSRRLLHLGGILQVGYLAPLPHVNARTVGLDACTRDVCKQRDEVFRPMIGGSVFIWPTSQTRLVKCGQDMLR